MRRVLICLMTCAALSLIETRAEAADIWTKDPNGWARHAASRLGCPPSLATKGDNGAGSVILGDVIVGSDRQPAGDQVGCEYEAVPGIWASVEITKLRDSESVAAQAAAIGNRIQARFPGAKRAGKKVGTNPLQGDVVTTSVGRKPTNPTGGETFTMAFDEIKVGNRTAVVAIAGGDVGGWMLTLVQLDYGDNAADLQALTVTNWEALVRARLGGRPTAARD